MRLQLEDAKTIKTLLEMFVFNNLGISPIQGLFSLVIVDRLNKGDKCETLVRHTSQCVKKISKEEKINWENIELPARPGIIREFEELVKADNHSIKDVADLINTSPTIAAVTIMIANNASLANRKRVDNVFRAVQLIGENELKEIIKAIVITSAFENISEELVDLPSLWKHSLGCALISTYLSKLVGIRDIDTIFTIALLHDIGRLVLYQNCPNRSYNAIITARKRKQLLYDTEKEVIGVTHAYVGWKLLNNWKFPHLVTDCVRHHHNPNSAGNQKYTAIVQLSDFLVNAFGIGSTGEIYCSKIDDNEVLREIEIDSSLLEIIQKIRNNVDELAKLMV